MKKLYSEPEFKALNINTQDVLTSSEESGATIPEASSGWETGGNVPVIGL